MSLESLPNFPKWWYNVEFYFRNNSTNNATLAHIVNDVTGKTFCGFNDPFAESVIGDETDRFVQSQLCKKCSKAHFLLYPKILVFEPIKNKVLEADANNSRQSAISILRDYDNTLEINEASNIINQWLNS